MAELLKQINNRMAMRKVIDEKIAIATPTIEDVKKLEQLVYKYDPEYKWFKEGRAERLYKNQSEENSCFDLYVSKSDNKEYASYMSIGEAIRKQYTIINIYDITIL